MLLLCELRENKLGEAPRRALPFHLPGLKLVSVVWNTVLFQKTCSNVS